LSADPQRVLADLRELAARTADDAGAQRVAWTETWTRARDLLRERLAELHLAPEADEAGNLWTVLPGRSERLVVVGSHLDSVPDGGPLDGALGVLAGLEVLRSVAADGTPPPASLALVDWADEEGARFGRSLLGSSAVAGDLDPDAVRDLTDAEGTTLEAALARHGVDLDRAPAAAARRERVAACLELHIEQGPVLEREGRPLAAVTGCLGVERKRIVLRGQPAHAGSTPMEDRDDPLVAAAGVVLAVRETAERHGGRGTVGRIVARPGTPTAVAAEVELVADLRHADAAELATMLRDVVVAAGERAAVEHVWSIEPIAFELVDLATAAAEDVTGEPPERLVSGALHDAASLARAGVPTAMLFVPSIGGLSHAREERTEDADIALGVQALERLVRRALDCASD